MKSLMMNEPAKPSALVRQKERVVEKILPTSTPDNIAEVFEEKMLPSTGSSRGVSKESTTETVT